MTEGEVGPSSPRSPHPQFPSCSPSPTSLVCFLPWDWGRTCSPSNLVQLIQFHALEPTTHGEEIGGGVGPTFD